MSHSVFLSDSYVTDLPIYDFVIKDLVYIIKKGINCAGPYKLNPVFQ